MFQNIDAARAFIAEKIHAVRILVVGDVMLDKYYYSEVTRICPEAPVPVARVVREKATLGGSANVAHNLARAGCVTALSGVAGRDENYANVSQMLDELKIERSGVVMVERPTTAKIRVVGGAQQMIRLDFEDASAITAAIEQKIDSYFRQNLHSFDGVILSDYGKGVCTADLCRSIIDRAATAGIPVFVDPKGSDWGKYTGAWCVTPNVKELSDAVGKHVRNVDAEVIEQGARVRSMYQLENLLVTRSEKGMTLIAEDGNDTLPIRAQEVYDVSGAGDTVISWFAAGICGGLSRHDASQLANYAAGIEVSKPGTYAVSKAELAAVLDGLAEPV